MKFIEFKKSLIKNISPIYVFYGDDKYLIETCIKNLQSSCEIKLPDMNISIFNEDATFQDVLLSLETLPFGDNYRIVLLSDYKLNDSEKDLIYNYAKNPNKSVCFVIVCAEEAMLAQKEGIVLVDCSKLDANLIKKKVTNDLSPRGYMISDNALKILISFCDFSLTKINSELEKLIAYAGDNKVITEEMVKDLSVKDVNYNIFELTTSLGEKNLEKSINIFNNLVKNADMNMVIGLLYGQFRRLLIVSISPAEMSIDSIANSLQVKPYSIKIAKEQAKKFGTKKLYNLCEKLQQIDVTIKSNFSDVENELYNFIFMALGE